MIFALSADITPHDAKLCTVYASVDHPAENGSDGHEVKSNVRHFLEKHGKITKYTIQPIRSLNALLNMTCSK